MKAVQLLPDESLKAQVVDAPDDTSVKMTVLAGVGVLLLVGGYFGYTKTTNLEAQAAQARLDAVAAVQTEQEVRDQIRELGERTSYANLANTTESAVLAAYEQRFPYADLLADINAVTPPESVMIDEINTESTDTGDPESLTLVGYADSQQTLAMYQTRLSAVEGLENLHVTEMAAATITSSDTIVRWTMTGTIDGNAFSSTGETSDDGTLVATGSSSLELALEPTPPKKSASTSASGGSDAEADAPATEPELTGLEGLAADTSSLKNDGGEL